MILEHFSPRPLQSPRDFAQPGPSSYGKPKGLWVSVRGENDWLEWCQAEQFNVPDGFFHRTLVHLNPSAKILMVRSEEELYDFDQAYSKPDLDMQRAGISDYSSLFRGPDWQDVATRFDGIIIAPYQWSLRFELNWYYGWDCASGCIWHSSAIDRLEEIDPPTFENEEEAA